jgi:hypothetical protein
VLLLLREDAGHVVRCLDTDANTIPTISDGRKWSVCACVHSLRHNSCIYHINFFSASPAPNRRMSRSQGVPLGVQRSKLQHNCHHTTFSGLTVAATKRLFCFGSGLTVTALLQAVHQVEPSWEVVTTQRAPADGSDITSVPFGSSGIPVECATNQAQQLLATSSHHIQPEAGFTMQVFR